MQDETREERLEEAIIDCQGTNQINIGGNTVTRSTEHLPEDQKKLLRWAFQHARDRRLSWTELEQKSGISTSTWYRIWHNRYINPQTKEPIGLDSVCKKIERWKKLSDQRAHMDETLFVKTSIWDRIEWLCGKALIRKKIGFIYGESHSGKTTCLKKFQELNNSGQTTYTELPPSAGVQLMTRTIARSLHVSTETCYERLVDDVIGALDDSKLLIVDEVHRVFTTYQKASVMRCLDVLRYIHDRTKCGMVLCGTNVFRDQLHEGVFKQYLKQLERRGLYEIQLPDMPPRSDLDLIAKHYGLDPADDDAEKTMLHLVHRHGIAVYFTRFDDAVEIAAKKGDDLTWDHFLRACAIVDRMRECR